MKLSVCVTYGRGSVLLWRQCEYVIYFPFVDDVTFYRNGAYIVARRQWLSNSDPPPPERYRLARSLWHGGRLYCGIEPYSYPCYCPIIFRPHRLHRCMQYVDAAYCYRCRTSVVCVSVCVDHTGELCKYGWTDRDAICGADSCEPKIPYIRWKPHLPMKRTLLRYICRHFVTYLRMSTFCVVHLLPLVNVPIQLTQRTNAFVVAKGWQDGDAAFYHITSDTCCCFIVFV